jgi:hypothetical protein
MAKRSKPSAEKKKYYPRELVKFAFWLLPSQIEECRNATAYLSRTSDQVSLSGLVADAIERELTRLKRKHTAGKPFPERSGDLRPGKRPKSD